MKKISFFVSLALASLFMGACTDSYTDWANPQAYSQQEAITLPSMKATPVQLINLTQASDSVTLFSLGQAKLPEGYVLADARVILTPAGKADATPTTINTTLDGKVAKATLQQYLVDNFGKRPTARTCDAQVLVSAIKDGQASLIDAGKIQVVATPVGPIIEDAYYLVGTMNDWNNTSKAFALTNGGGDVYEDPVFTITLKAPADGKPIEFKLYPVSGLGTDNQCITKVQGTDDKFLIGNSGDKFVIDPVPGAKYYKLSFNLMDKTYTVQAMSDPELFLTGSSYGWGETWKQLVPVHSTTDTFWTIIYLTQGEQFKFAPQAAWGKDFGGQATINDQAGAGLTASDGNNLLVGHSGWYLLEVINNDKKKVVNVLEPNVYLIGETAGGWTTAVSHKFTVPTTPDGDFVSPAFVAAGEVRMCVALDGYDWWKTEFIVTKGGKIDYRGKGDDQARVRVNQGEKVYLNFTNGTGKYE